MFRSAFTILLIGLVFPVWADDIADLCQKDIEGTYLGKLEGQPVRVNLVCLDKKNIAATVCPALDDKGTFSIQTVVNMSNAAIDEDELDLANFGLENEARPNGSSKSIVSYLTLDMKSLLIGQLNGQFMSGAMADFQSLVASRIETYPVWASALEKPLASKSANGVFKTDMPEDLDSMNLVFRVLLGTPVISLVGVHGHFVSHFTEGPRWDASSGIFSSATPEGNGGEPDDKKMSYLRGHFKDADHVEFYLIHPVTGRRGPFHGVRIPAPSSKEKT